MKHPSAKIGLALGSGGWRGLAHIGVIKSLVKHHFTIDIISGSSAGALIGGLYAYFLDIEKVENIFIHLNYKDLLFMLSDPSIKLGILRGGRTTKLLQKYLGDVNIEDLSIRFAAIASDILTGQPVVFSSGNLATAIRASGSIPLLFEPVHYDNKILIDGGAVNPIPVSTAKKLGADIVIGVNIYKSIFSRLNSNQPISKIDLVNLSYRLILSSLASKDISKANLIIEPEVENHNLDPISKFTNNQHAINQGELAMDLQIEKLRHLLCLPKLR